MRSDAGGYPDNHNHFVMAGDIDAMVEAAERQGISAIAFSEHNFHLDEAREAIPYLAARWTPEGPPLPLARYVEEVRTAGERSRVQVLLGLEVDVRPEDDAFEQATDAFTAHRDDWDIVLGSVHTMSDDVSVQDEPVAMSPDDAWADYLGRVTIAAGSGRFDVISHPVRLGYSMHGIPAAVPSLLDGVARVAASEGVAVEVNGADFAATAGSRGAARRDPRAPRRADQPGLGRAPAELRRSRARGAPAAAGAWRPPPRAVRATADGAGPASQLAHKLRDVKRYHVTTFGCQMNVHDSERIKGLLESLGLGEAPSQDEADVVVFNTCTIREKADDRFVTHLMQARAAKERHPERSIVVGGCWSESMKDELFERYPFVDLAFGPGNISRLGDFIGAGGELPAGPLLDVRRVRGRPARAPRSPAPGVGADLDGLQLDLLVLHRAVRARPRAVAVARDPRGRGRGARAGRRARDHAARPERQLVGARPAACRSGSASAGCCGGSTPCPASSASATRARTRRTCATTSSPRIASAPRSASTSTCRCSRARRASCARCAAPTRVSATSRSPSACVTEVPGLALTTDIIVGFPGETEDDFRETLEVVDEVGYDHAFTFIYSPRRGTDAGRMESQVPEDVKHERLERLVERIQAHADARNQRARRHRRRGARRGHVAHRSRTRTRQDPHEQDRDLPGAGRARHVLHRAGRVGHVDDAAGCARARRRHRAERCTRSSPSSGRRPPARRRLALALAERGGGEVVAADAMGLYAGLPVLTAQPTPAERERAPHRLVGVWPLDHVGLGRRVCARSRTRRSTTCRARGRLPIVTGGTGSTCAPRSSTWRCRRASTDVRARCASGSTTREGGEAAHAALARRDPRAAAAIHPNDRRRVVRALELARSGASLRPRRRPALERGDARAGDRVRARLAAATS